MTPPQPIPLVDLGAQHRDVADEVLAGFAEVLATTAFIGGPQVAAFEREFADYCETSHCVGAANGTDAIELVLRGLDIGRGDEVIIPANTFIATAEAVVRAGADVVLVDCTDDTLLIDPELVDAAVTARTRAVIGVDLYGQIAPFDRLADVVDAERIALVEDAAQSQGAVRNDRKVGADVAAAATSFYPGKNLGAYGDAGAVVTNDGNLAERVRAIGGHGGLRRYEHDLVGFNSRLDTLQAVVLSTKLRRLDGWNKLRRQAAARYDELLDGVESVTRLTTAPGNIPVWHLYPIRVRGPRSGARDAARCRHRRRDPLPPTRPSDRGVLVARPRRRRVSGGRARPRASCCPYRCTRTSPTSNRCASSRHWSPRSTDRHTRDVSSRRHVT